MPYKFELAQRAHSYLRRLAKEYRVTNVERLADVLEGSLFLVREETSFDNWNGGTYGHDVIIYVPDELIGLVPLDQQGELQEKLKEDLNKAATSVENEFFSGVHFEYLDDPATAPSQAIAIIAGKGPKETAIGSSPWQPNSIRLFISHRDTDKKIAHSLAAALEKSGVSSFVAHDAIEPDEDWQREIERALQSMDAMLTLITDTFFASAWTNQEIGFALGRGVPVISLKLGPSDPIGFIRNRQAIKGVPLQAQSNANAVIEVLAKRLPESSHLRRGFLVRFANSTSFFDAEERFDAISRLQNISEEEISLVVRAHNENSQIAHCFALMRTGRLLNFINEHSSRKFILSKSKIIDDDEMPF